MTGWTTAGLYDAHAAGLRLCTLPLRDFGGRIAFRGPVRTVRCRGDNTPVRAALAEPGGGAVLVVDAAGLLDCALIGDRLAAEAARLGWAGIVVNGAVRDVVSLRDIPLGLKALGPCPRPSAKGTPGERDVPVAFGGAAIAPGDWLYADADGVVVAARRLD
ncbi:ribonuclease E activity regulator RraA [Elioraea sp.]|jgi:regulator of ribonuclease activity A|uniref:ribonuclease E activity regulator RraA n=1 Tax=Elioraea sp. TaxID=2185103 RepID=UPI0021DC4A5A|nr:ribonuclease E activity regulator RraA [Elioraea sp.]GIX09100.1 MAG: putative 4-hydroxy-4-methyl-2-oxoglutarate aldolase [Elioraea sp.]